MKTNSRLWTCMGILLFGVLYSFVLFALKKSLTLSEWILYGFTILSLIIAMIWFCMKAGSTKEYPMFGLPLSRLVCIYCGCQFVFGGILGMLLPLPSEYHTVLIEVIVLGVFAVIAVFLNSRMGYVRRLDEEDHRNVSHIREMTASANAIRNLLKEPEQVQKADRMVEALQYTDPTHRKETEGIEQRIENNLRILREDIEAGEMGSVSFRLDNIISLVKERADIIIALKK